MSLSTSSIDENPLNVLDNHIPYEIEAALFYREAAAILRLTKYSLTGFSDFFRIQSKEEFRHADELIDYLSKRDHEFHFGVQPIVEIETRQNAYETLLHILDLAVQIEIKVYNSFLNMTHLDDPSLQDVAIKWVHEQEEEVQTVKTLYYKVRDSGPINVYIIDQRINPS